MKERRIGLVGAGNMAKALIRGLLVSQTVRAEELRASDTSRAQLEEVEAQHAIRTHTDNRELLAWANLVILAVKPQVLETLLPELSPHFQPETLVISVAAGVPTQRIEADLPESIRVIRAMPNAPAMALAAATAISPGTRATSADLATARDLFQAIGHVVALEEGLLDAVTGLSGSGPAYVMLLVEALTDGGIKMGLPGEVATTLAAQTVLGAARLLIETGEPPSRLRERITSPGGTTVAGLGKLEAAGFRQALVDAVEAAARRSEELGRSALRTKG